MALNIPQILKTTISETTRLLPKPTHAAGEAENVLHLDIGPGQGDLIKLLRNKGGLHFHSLRLHGGVDDAR